MDHSRRGRAELIRVLTNRELLIDEQNAEIDSLRTRLAAVTAERDAAEGLLERVLALKVLPSARDVAPSISQFARLGVDIESHLRGRTDR